MKKLEEASISYQKLEKDNQYQFMHLLSITFDFGKIISIDYEYAPGFIKVSSYEMDFFIELIEITENHSTQEQIVKYCIWDFQQYLVEQCD